MVDVGRPAQREGPDNCISEQKTKIAIGLEKKTKKKKHQDELTMQSKYTSIGGENCYYSV